MESKCNLIIGGDITFISVICTFNKCLLQSYWQQVKQDDRPATALGALKKCNKAQFPNIYTILHLLVVCPVTSCEAERSFSSLRRLKDYMRTTMTEERLNGLTMMMVHRDIEVNVSKVIDTFAARCPRKMELVSVLDDPEEDEDQDFDYD